MVRLSGIEPETHCLEGSCSIQLSYRRGEKSRETKKSNQRYKEKKETPGGWDSRTFKLLEHFLVGAVRFELTAPWSQTKCATAALRPGQKSPTVRPLGPKPSPLQASLSTTRQAALNDTQAKNNSSPCPLPQQAGIRMPTAPLKKGFTATTPWLSPEPVRDG